MRQQSGKWCLPGKDPEKRFGYVFGHPWEAGTAGLEAVEVEAGVKPLELRREELAIRPAEGIMMKGDEECIKVS